MRVLVTGGAGFIGSHLVDALLRCGHQVRVLDNFDTGRRENLLHVADDVEILEGDIRDGQMTHAAVGGCEVVLHQAALRSVARSVHDPVASNAVNVAGTLNVLVAARDAGVRRVVFASSSSVYGAASALPNVESMPTLPVSPYAVSKLAGESYCRSFSEVYGLETVALRYFNVFGPRQDPLSAYATVIPAFISDVIHGRRPRIFGDGEQSRDFTYVDNVVHGTMLAMDARDVSGTAINMACGQRVTLNEVLAEIKRQVGSEVDAEYLAPRAGDVRDTLGCIQHAREQLGYEVRVGFKEGLSRTIEQLRSAPDGPSRGSQLLPL